MQTSLGGVPLHSAASDVRLHIRVARQHASVGAALGLPRWLARGQHVVSGPRVLRQRPPRRLAGLEPAVDQGHQEQHHGPHHGGHPGQGEGQGEVPKVVMEET